MEAIEIARRLVELNQKADAVKAYELVLSEDSEPAELLESAIYLFENSEDYHTPYSVFVQLYNAGRFQKETLAIMREAFYEPNVKQLKDRYVRNCKLLEKYPYLFKKDFLPFEELPLQFFPYDDHNGYVPFNAKAETFLDFVNVRDTIISRNFFRDLEKPVLASDVFSQYELEYLNDNVRPSEWVGRENHIYLHYTDWAEFCSWLQVLTVKPLVDQEKVVFLIGGELAQYPIDFKERFGVDYGQYPAKSVGIREVNKLIWHMQLSSDNGGDFFNEVFDAHPNLICLPSVLMESIEKELADAREALTGCRTEADALAALRSWDSPEIVRELFSLSARTDKDYIVAIYLAMREYRQFIDPAARIAPALFLQPHFRHPSESLAQRGSGEVEAGSSMRKSIDESPLFRGFKYIKAFAPLRRFTTSYAAMIRYKKRQTNPDVWQTAYGALPIIGGTIAERIANRGYMRVPGNRLYRDCVVVRFEDGKLNPEATFTALASFLDIPYTESMTYCSERGIKDVATSPGNAVGFDPVTVYRTYDEFAGTAERRYIEFAFRDAYPYYGYDFQYYDGSPVTEEQAYGWVRDFDTLDRILIDNLRQATESANLEAEGNTAEEAREKREEIVKDLWKDYKIEQVNAIRLLLGGLRFVDEQGRPLEMIPLLRPDPDLLEKPLYH